MEAVTADKIGNLTFVLPHALQVQTLLLQHHRHRRAAIANRRTGGQALLPVGQIGLPGRQPHSLRQLWLTSVKKILRQQLFQHQANMAGTRLGAEASGSQ
ncbi:hypothetical protein D3C80_459390 [compost metagenome]